MDRGPYAIATACLGALLTVLPLNGAAQSMFKCRDDRGRVTYSNVTCEKQGLKDAGAVADRSTTLPLAPAQKALPPRKAAATDDPEVGATKAPSPGKPATTAATDDPELGAPKAPAQIKPVNPLIERLLK